MAVEPSKCSLIIIVL